MILYTTYALETINTLRDAVNGITIIHNTLNAYKNYITLLFDIIYMPTIMFFFFLITKKYRHDKNEYNK